MRSISILLAAMIMFSGCATQDAETTQPTLDDVAEEPKEDPTQESAPPAPKPKATEEPAPKEPAPEPEPEDALPVLAITASVTESEVPYLSELSIDASDADGDTPTWVVSKGGSEVASGEGVGSAILNITTVGEHEYTVQATSGGETVSETITLVGKPVTEVSVDDPADDAQGDMLDLLGADVKLGQSALYLNVSVGDVVYPSNQGIMPWFYLIYINDVVFETNWCFPLGADGHEDHSALMLDGACLSDDTLDLDNDNDQLLVTLTYEELESAGITAPYAIAVHSHTIPTYLHEDTRKHDVLPDEGTIVLG